MATNPYYVVTGAPVTQSRGVSATIRSEYSAIHTGFDAVYVAMLLRGLKGGETWTGTHVFTGATVTFATQSALDSSTKAATTAYADAAVAALAATKADIASPTFTGTPSAPTAAAGTSTTQIATTEFVATTAFSSVLPGQTGNSGKFVKTNGSAASWEYAGITNVTTATTATTLTSTPTLLQITPASYGVAVTLPDATTCSVGGPLHIIDNKGVYPVRVLNSAGTLLGFIFAGVVSHVSLIDNSTAAGVWTIENSELVGASAQLLTPNLTGLSKCVSLDASRELLVGRGPANVGFYGVVYNKSTNTFGSVTLIRATINGIYSDAVLSATDQVLCVSCDNGAATFEAVTLSISGTTITVNTAATSTLSANISAFADGCGLIAVGSSFVCSYTVATPAAQIRALSISGTTVTIGSATVLDGTAGGLIAASASHVIALSNATTHVYTKPYLVSGSTLTAGTGSDDNHAGSTTSVYKLAAWGSYWFFSYISDAGISAQAGVVSLNATGNGTTTTSKQSCGFSSSGSLADAIIVSSTKALCLGASTTSNANIITNTAGTASAGTAITLSVATTRTCICVVGTDVYVSDTGTGLRGQKVDCSGASPVLTSSCLLRGEGLIQYLTSASNSVLNKAANLVFSSTGATNVSGITSTGVSSVLRSNLNTLKVTPVLAFSSGTGYRGKADSERWVTDAATLITKFECVV